METLPQFRLRSYLREAFDSIAIGDAGFSTSRHFQRNRATAAVSTSQSCQDSQDPLTTSITAVDRSPNCPSLLDQDLSTNATSADLNSHASSFEGTQAASILSNIPGNAGDKQSHQDFSASGEAREPPPPPSPMPTAPLISEDGEEVSTSCPCPQNLATGGALSSANQAVTEPTAVLDSLQLRDAPLPSMTETSFGWAQSPMSFMAPGQETCVFELANPLSSWQPTPHEDLLDWCIALGDYTTENPIRDNPSSTSNQFPLASLECEKLYSTDGLTLGEGDVLNPLTLPSRSMDESHI